MILLMSIFTMTYARPRFHHHGDGEKHHNDRSEHHNNEKPLYKKERLRTYQVWEERAKRKFHSKDSIGGLKADIKLQLHHIAGTVEYIVKEAKQRKENEAEYKKKMETIQKIESEMNKVLEEGDRLEHATHDKEKLEAFLKKVEKVRKEFKIYEEQRKRKSKHSSGGMSSSSQNFLNNIANSLLLLSVIR